MGYNPTSKKEIPVFGPSWNLGLGMDAIFIDSEYVDELHLISDREVK